MEKRKMKRLTIGDSVTSSSIALGCMRLAELDVQEAERLVMTAVEEGINLFDHADIYGSGQSETIFGEVLRRHPGLRDNMLIQGKCGIRQGYYDSSKEHILAAVDGSLKRLGVDYLDFLLIHRPDALVEPEEVAEAFHQLEQSGKVRAFGVSNHNSFQIELLQKYVAQRLVINQMQLSLAHTIMIDAGINVNTYNEEAIVRDSGTLDYCRLNDITIQAWSPFQYGMFGGVFLTSDQYQVLNRRIGELAESKGVSDVAIAMAWILRHPANIQPIAGTTKLDRLKEICRAFDVELTRSEWYSLYTAAGNPLP